MKRKIKTHAGPYSQRSAEVQEHPPFKTNVPLRWPELDSTSRAWWVRLHAEGMVRDNAITELHTCLRREARFHVRTRSSGRSQFPQSDIEDLATQAADDALLAVLRKLDDYRGESQFLTWARRFVQLEAAVSIRRRIGRDYLWASPSRVSDTADPECSHQEWMEAEELLGRINTLVDVGLTEHQRAIFTAIVFKEVPARKLAMELGTTPGAIYKTLHDARAKLIALLALS